MHCKHLLHKLVLLQCHIEIFIALVFCFLQIRYTFKINSEISDNLSIHQIKISCIYIYNRYGNIIVETLLMATPDERPPSHYLAPNCIAIQNIT